jgi:hypothetical protein
LLITEGVKRVVAANLYADKSGIELLARAGVEVSIIQAPLKPHVICLCGSSRFKDEINAANVRLTLAGNLVLSLGLFGHADFPGMNWETGGSGTKIMLDELHKRKIDLADEIFVVNVDGYIGESTYSEIDYAVAHGKQVRYLEEMQ